MTRTEYLQQLWDSLRPVNYGQAVLEFRPFSGWFVVHEEAAYFGDDGRYVGSNWHLAEQEIRFLCRA